MHADPIHLAPPRSEPRGQIRVSWHDGYESPTCTSLQYPGHAWASAAAHAWGLGGSGWWYGSIGLPRGVPACSALWHCVRRLRCHTSAIPVYVSPISTRLGRRKSALVLGRGVHKMSVCQLDYTQPRARAKGRGSVAGQTRRGEVARRRRRGEWRD